MSTTAIYYKQFNSASFAAADQKSRTVVKAYMKTKGFTFQDNPDKFGIDLLGQGFETALELEHRNIWNGSQYPYPTYHLPARKLKYFISNYAYKPYFIVINADFTFALMISREKLLPHLDMEKVQTVICQQDYKDSFFDIPISDFTLIDLAK